VEALFEQLLGRLCSGALDGTDIIPWSCPVPLFGDLKRARLATLGLNPSNREFVDEAGEELDGSYRRFHTLNSLGLQRWSEAKPAHLAMIAQSCRDYFRRNPYEGWFGRLDRIIAGAGVSYYDAASCAVHLDLVPFATACKWTELRSNARRQLESEAAATLGAMLRRSRVRVLVLNGQSVVDRFEAVAETKLNKQSMRAWSLPRRSGDHVTGYSYEGMVSRIGGIPLPVPLTVLGYNHNIQSSFGVTNRVQASIADWVGRSARERLQ
jgi:hypothetical protein